MLTQTNKGSEMLELSDQELIKEAKAANASYLCYKNIERGFKHGIYAELQGIALKYQKELELRGYEHDLDAHGQLVVLPKIDGFGNFYERQAGKLGEFFKGGENE